MKILEILSDSSILELSTDDLVKHVSNNSEFLNWIFAKLFEVSTRPSIELLILYTPFGQSLIALIKALESKEVNWSS